MRFPYSQSVSQLVKQNVKLKNLPMKKPPFNSNTRGRKVACTVSAAALMLGVSHSATVGFHFQSEWQNATAYSGKLVTATAFGVPANSWENLTPLRTGYYGDNGPFSTNELISTTTSTGGLHPLPQGSVNLAWACTAANVTGFAGYGVPYGAPSPNPGEEEVYYSFLRDDKNIYTTPAGGPIPYSLSITGLKSVWPNSPYVIQIVNASDTASSFANANIGSLSNHIQVTFPSTQSSVGVFGALSTGSGPITNDSINIWSDPATAASGSVAIAGTIAGFIITDQPVVTMSPRSVLSYAGDHVTLSPYAIGVPPLSYQWRLNGKPVAGATNLTYDIPSVTATKFGLYDLVVTNAYGSATSKVATVTGGLFLGNASNLVADSNPNNSPRVGVDSGATWLASSSDGVTTRSGVMQFVATNANSITVPGSSNFDVTNGTVSFWMRSAGNDTASSPGSSVADLFGRVATSGANGFLIGLNDDGTLLYYTPENLGQNNGNTSTAKVADNKWHLVTVTFDSGPSGGVAVYVDGAQNLTNNNNVSWSWPTNQAQIELGYSSDSTIRDFNGQLDDVRVYSRILTPAEVASVYNTGALIDTANLQARYNFDKAPVNGYTLTWIEANSVLQSATTASGPYTDVTGSFAPYNFIPGAGQKFFRYRYPTHVAQTINSNPVLQ